MSYAQELLSSIIEQRRVFIETNTALPRKVYLPIDYRRVLGEYFEVFCYKTGTVNRPLDRGDRLLGMDVVPTDEINMSISR